MVRFRNTLLLALVMLTALTTDSVANSTVDAALARVRGDVGITVDPRAAVAHFEIQEEFRNLTGSIIEADYMFPVPRGAVFTNLSLYAGETELRGEMLRSENANAIYEDIVSRLKDPALVELAGRDLIRARVFPVQPGETRKIILRYSVVLPRAGDAFRLTYPRNLGLMAPRQFPAGPIEPWVDTSRRPMHPQPQFDLRVRVRHADDLGEVTSPTSQIDVRRSGDELIVRELPSDSSVSAAFNLFLPLRSASLTSTLVTHAPGHESGYFMFTVRPPYEPSGRRIERDVAVVLDVSGSMSGHKIEQARDAIEQVLRGLQHGDRFRLLTFSSAVREFRSGFTAAAPEEIENAVRYLRGVPADGSTNIDDALRRALSASVPEGRMSVVLFMTDGLPTVNETDPVRIAQMAADTRGEHRVFAFGIGDDVNTFLLDRLVQDGRGAVDYVRPGDDVAEAVGSLGRRISAPALTDLTIVAAPVGLEDMMPARLPDLFYGEDLVLTGRYRGAGSGEIVLAGNRGGSRETHRFEVAFAADRPCDDFVARLWAARKAGALATSLRVNGHNDELVEEIRQLGLRYGVLTEFTAYLVQEPDMAFDRREAVRVAERLAAAPAAQSGADAVAESARRNRMAQAGEWEVAEEEMAAFIDERADATDWQRVGSRLFLRRDGVWRDLRADPALAVVRIESNSPAWFELAARVPGLVPALRLGDRVIIAGSDLVIDVGAGGRTDLDQTTWDRIESAFGR